MTRFIEFSGLTPGTKREVINVDSVANAWIDAIYATKLQILFNGKTDPDNDTVSITFASEQAANDALNLLIQPECNANSTPVSNYIDPTTLKPGIYWIKAGAWPGNPYHPEYPEMRGWVCCNVRISHAYGRTLRFIFPTDFPHYRIEMGELMSFNGCEPLISEVNPVL